MISEELTQTGDLTYDLNAENADPTALAPVVETFAAPVVHPQTGLAITTTGKHWYGQEPLALHKHKGVRMISDVLAQTGDISYQVDGLTEGDATALAPVVETFASPVLHPQTGLAITTTGKHWYGQEPLALHKHKGVRMIADELAQTGDISYQVDGLPEDNKEALTPVVETFAAPVVHPQTGLPITTTGKHWYGQEPLALNHVVGVRLVTDPVL